MRLKISESLKLVAEAFERPANRARVKLRCNESSATPSTAAFLALIAKRGDFKNCCKALTLDNQCISGLAAESKELCETVVQHELADAATKATFKDRKKNVRLLSKNGGVRLRRNFQKRRQRTLDSSMLRLRLRRNPKRCKQTFRT